MSGDGGFGRDSGTPKRRMLPAVTDVVRELARTVSADPAVLFKAARSVVADELGKVKQGFESAPLDVLVRRARRQLEQEGVAAPVPEEPEEQKSVSIPAPPLMPKKTGLPVVRRSVPGSRRGRPRVGEGPQHPCGRRAVPLGHPPAAAPVARAGDRAAGKDRRPGPAAPDVAAPPPPSFSRLPAPDRVLAPEGLAVERSGPAPRPKPAVDDLPLFASPTLELSSPLAPAPPPVARRTRRSRAAARRGDPGLHASRTSSSAARRGARLRATGSLGPAAGRTVVRTRERALRGSGAADRDSAAAGRAARAAGRAAREVDVRNASAEERRRGGHRACRARDGGVRVQGRRGGRAAEEERQDGLDRRDRRRPRGGRGPLLGREDVSLGRRREKGGGARRCAEEDRSACSGRPSRRGTRSVWQRRRPR